MEYMGANLLKVGNKGILKNGHTSDVGSIVCERTISLWLFWTLKRS